VGLFTSLLTRVISYTGPRDLSTGIKPQDGYARQASQTPIAQTRWHLSDLESAILSADTGNMRMPGRLCRAIRRDGTAFGVLSTRTDGLVQLPVRFSGSDSDLVDALAGEFRAVFPSSELALLSGDGRMLGVGVGEFVQIKGSLPVLKRLDPEFLQYRWYEDRWYYQSIHGIEPVNPGDGRWVLHCPGGAVQPWTHGMWPALGRAYIAKEHAFFLRENFASKLANSARVGTVPQGASQPQREGFFAKLAAWGINSVFELPEGYDIKLIESQGRGYQIFQDTIKTSNEEMIITIAGQLTTTTGGAAFSNSAIGQAIRGDLIQSDADALASTLNTQGVPVWANERFGPRAAESDTRVAWDVTAAKDLNAEALAVNQAAIAAKAMNEILAPLGKRVDIIELARRYGVKVVALEVALELTAANDVPSRREAA
jgi:hypothetical protein